MTHHIKGMRYHLPTQTSIEVSIGDDREKIPRQDNFPFIFNPH
ncbi:Uncharacterised protein [Vibrio cholerae]|uniref:Uncharacterized protein n=1 Tax=Vibrio cholerae TaxID=666 RepID=A0A655YZR5_VIBCL|nr:Uncharacterised protein [Vibrio cholerae]